MTTIDRRAFLRRTSALLGASGLGLDARAPAAGPDATGEAAIPIVDTHQHLWDLDRFRLPWLRDDPDLDRNYLMADYLGATEGLGIVKTVYMEVDVDPAQHVAEAEYAIGVCRGGETPMVGAVIGGRPASGDFGAYLDRFRSEPAVKGVRQVLHGSTPKGYCLDPQFLKGIRQLGEHGLSFDICIRPDDLVDAARLADACPGTTLVLDHCGNPKGIGDQLAAWGAGILRLAERRNVACKVSGLAIEPYTIETLRPIVNHVLDAFGPDRVVFGGDWPVCTKVTSIRGWVEALRAIVGDRDADARRKLWHDNARRIYRL